MSVRRRARAAVKARHEARRKVAEGIERMQLELLEQWRKDLARLMPVRAAE